MTELLWHTDEGDDRFCYTSFEKSLTNKPNFETVAIPDEFMNIVKDCVKANQKLLINLHDETYLRMPPMVLKRFIDGDKTK